MKHSRDPGDARLRARIAATLRHAGSDGRTSTRAARAAFLATFERLVDPDGVLPPEERERRASLARRAHFQRLALLSRRARRRRQ
jgi:hypothetical protein